MIIFFIQNKKSDYEKCFLVMKFLYSGEIFHLDTSIKIQYINDNIIKYKNKTNNETKYNFNLVYNNCLNTTSFIEVNNSESLTSIIGLPDKKYTFCFYINEMGENDDVVQFHYFELIRQYEEDSYLLVESTQENYFRISDFYQIESRLYETTYSHRYFKVKSENRVKRFALNNNNSSRYFLPLFRTENEIYSLLSKNILDLFHFSEDKLLNFETSKANDLQLNNKLAVEVIQDFYAKLLKEINHNIEKKKININWNSYKDIISHTSVLGLCYFLSYLYTSFCNKSFNFNLFEINQLLLQSEDFAIGSLQLFENALKHAKYGFFCYRIHYAKDKKVYLNDNYDIKLDDKTAAFYLEILISDFNEDFDIPKKFIKNLSDRQFYNSEANSELICNLKKNLQLKDFFNPSESASEFWRKYYGNTSNIALHYGLNIFEQVIKSSLGKYILISSNNTKLTENEIYGLTSSNADTHTFVHIPGTQYKIILPIQNNYPLQQSTGFKSQLDIKQLKKKWDQHTIRFVKDESSLQEFSEYYIPFSTFKNNTPKYKEDSILKLLEIFRKKVHCVKKNTIFVFDVKEFSSSLQSEVFSKALICLLGEMTLKKIAIINASHQFMSMFIRVFGLLYYKKDTRTFLSNSDVYLCGCFNLKSDNNVEILFKGSSIEDSLFVSKQMADYKGEFSMELSILENIAKKCEKSISRKRSTTIFPFDVLVKNKNNTLFQEKTVYDLHQDLQHYHFGCRLSDVHMKVGSKIHITSDFYEATLLFSIKNYISRFAYLLSKNIYEIISSKSIKTNIVLIGYETYSEILIIETQNILKQVFNIDVKYLIYDDSLKKKKFRSTNNYSNLNNANYIIIVPIGSTLTTHDKIAAELRREFQLDNNNNIVANLCVVLVRDVSEGETLTKNENIFWTSINELFVILDPSYNIGSKNIVNYIVSVSSKWQRPDECSSCFPELLSDEKPILKVNKASVVPMIMMGIKEKNNQPLEYKKMKSFGDISKLKNHLKFGHIKRGDNHFEYYFNTESIITDKSIQESLNSWFREIKKTLKNEYNKTNFVKYDFVVAPQHTTNAEFVILVNENVFDNPASVLFLDVKKEYRDNIKTKFSNLTQLYNNLVSYGRQAIINFHYVDDTITTGGSFNRTKSLIQSLFPEDSLTDTTCGNVKVNVFNSVILLLGRCSYDTRLSFAPSGKFFAFFELNISTMRNYEDACVLCKKYNDYEEMRKLSATNSMENVFRLQANNYHEIKYTEDSPLNQDDGFKRMFITHDLNQRIADLGFEKNNNDTIEHIILQFIVDIFNDVFSNIVSANSNDCLCILLLVISSPFPVFRKSVLSASFKILLKISEYLIFPEVRNCDAYLPNLLKKHIISIEENQDKSDLKYLIKTLFESISNLGANFVMQTKTINSFFAYVKRNFLNDNVENSYKEWIIYYCQIIIQSLMLNRQDSRVLWLEKTLVEDSNENIKITLNEDRNIQMLKKIMLLENTLILSDTLDEAVYSIQNTIKKLKDKIKTEIAEDIYQSSNTDILQQKFNNFIKISEETDTDLLLTILFNSNGELRYEKEFIKSLEITVKAYFCEAFRNFSKINNDSLGVQQLLNMSILYLLLLPNSSLSGERKEHLKFYDTLLKQIKSVLQVNKVQLFMSHDETIDFICSSDGNNTDCDTEYEECLKEFVQNPIDSIGETYYINQKKSCLNAIKIDNNSFSDKDKTQTAWYLVFEVENHLPILKLLTNARNLLVMRENLLLRLKKDYDNNLYSEFSDLRKKVEKLTDDKAGGHTPFAELSAEFDYLYDLSQKPIDSKEEIANSMKFITDLLISKLYVCHINDDSYPKQIETRKTEMQYHCLSNYKKILLSANSLVLRKDNSLIIQPEISFDIDWDAEFEFMKKAAFIWIAIFYALIMNSLRHGQSKSVGNDQFLQCVHIDVKTDENYLIISNVYISQDIPNKRDGITLETISAFLSHYGFSLEIDNEDDYIVKISLNQNLSKKKGNHQNEENFIN